MKPILMLTVLALGLLIPLGSGTHDQGCIPTRADPSTTYVLDTPDGRRFYIEERASFNDTWLVDPPTSPAPPTWGFWFGGGTWVYEETNQINAPEGSMQRGTFGFGACFKPFPCLIIDDDPITDSNCGHGPDSIIF